MYNLYILFFYCSKTSDSHLVLENKNIVHTVNEKNNKLE